MIHRLPVSWLRAICGLILLLTISLSIRAIPGRFAQLNQLAPELNLQTGALGPPQVAALELLGLTIPDYAGYITAMESVTAFIGILVGLVIYWRRNNDPIALIVSIALTTLGTFASPLMTFVATINPLWARLHTILQFIAIGPSFLIFYIFPDGRFIPSWTKWFWVAWMVYNVSWLVYPALKPPVTLFAIDSISPALLWFVLIFLISGVYAQIMRFRYFSSPTQQQQTKWIVFGFSVTLITLIAIGLLVRSIVFDTRTPGGMVFLLTGITAVLIALALAPITVMVSILQYRLWDIDLIIRRTLSYAVLSGLLAMIYFSGVTVTQAIISNLTQQFSTISIIFSTLAIAALFNPLRQSIQQFIDQRFNRSKYDAEKVLAGFANAAQSQTDLEQLSQDLVAAAQITLQPEQVSLWLKPLEAGRSSSIQLKVQP